MNDWEKAGTIAAQTREYGRLLVVSGASALDICEKMDAKIRELGAIPAFPTQIALNDVAAHFCPTPQTDIILSDEVVSIDCGACVSGAIGDTACTVDLSGEHADLVKAAQDALAAAISIIKPGVAVREVGHIIQKTITDAGFVPVANLSGHGLGLYRVHAPPTIPNVDNGDPTLLEEGMIFAIEPFVTTGVGRVKEAGVATIFSQIGEKPVRSLGERKVMQALAVFEKLPFASRWIEGVSLLQLKMALQNLKRIGVLTDHPPLLEEGKGLVAQAEHSVMVTSDGCLVLTK